MTRATLSAWRARTVARVDLRAAGVPPAAAAGRPVIRRLAAVIALRVNCRAAGAARPRGSLSA